jgi:flagellar M-ring protein FliF
MFKESERPSKASVTLKMAGGETPRAETVHGIASMVANSVGGLDPEHVTIVDERGQALTFEDESSVAGLSSRQLAVQREVETYMEQKADKLLNSLVGSGNARVQVAASINFDKVERTVQAVDPERQALATEQKAEVTPSTPTQGAGSSTTATSYENTKSVESFSGAIGNVKKLTVAVLVADKVTMPAPDTTQQAAPAPIITARTTEEIARIETLVRNALGVDSTRGDMISVVSAPFDMPAPPVIARDSVLPPADMLSKLQANPKPIVAIAALVVLLVIAVVSVSALKPKKSQRTAGDQPNLLPPNEYPQLPASSAMQSAMQETTPYEEDMVELPKRPIRLPPQATTPEREQAIATVEQRPDAAVRVVRTWLRS